ncbi:phytoene desaturase family protein [Chloroflexota bacterium]
MDKSIIIIGAGLAGLSAGCYGQMNGCQSHIFEHHTKPGGVAATWKRKDYLVDGGIHWLMGYKPGQSSYEMYRELGALPSSRCLEMRTYAHFVDEAAGKSVEIIRDLKMLASELKAISPADFRVIDDLVDGARRLQGYNLFGTFMSKPPELMGPFAWMKTMWGLRQVFFNYFNGRYAQPVADHAQSFQDPWLRRAIENLFLPEVPVWFILMLLALLADGQMGLLESGSLEFALTIEQRYRELGGQVTYKAMVEEILVEHDQAVGVRLADGSEHRADVIVSAADGYSTIYEMLGGLYVNKRIESRYQNWKLFRPIVLVSFGVAREFRNEPSMNIILLKQPLTVGHQNIEGISLRIFNYSPRFAPSGKTVVQAMFETEWDFWSELRKDRARYEVEKERIAREVLERLEARYPGLSSLVEITDVATPYTTWRYTRNYRGAFEGWLPSTEVINTNVERTLPGLSNLYMAGQWVMPGGGVPACLYSGRHVVQILCQQDRNEFVTNTT